MIEACDERLWAEQEFGPSPLGDRRRAERAVQMAATAATRPGGKITSVFQTVREREAAYRFVQNDLVEPEALMEGPHRAAAQRSRPYEYVYVAGDQTDLRLTDWQQAKGLGAVGTRKTQAQGLQVVSGMSISPTGTPLGLLAQAYWARKVGKKKPAQARRNKKPEDKETGYWLQIIEQSCCAMQAEAPGTRPWFQFDRGGDAWPLFLAAKEAGAWLTVRAAWDRRLWTSPKEPRQYLWGTVEQQEPMGDYQLAVPPRRGRPGRLALLQLRVAHVTLDLHDHLHNQHHRMPLWAVLVREEAPPAGAEAIEWMLLSTYPVESVEAAQEVVFAYSQRWRIEDFHNLWKSGACRIEESQLRELDPIVRWAVVLASVAVRILRLTWLSRHEPELPATVEFTQPEIDAVIVATHQRTWQRGQVPPIGAVALWIAEYGGYTGKSSGGPPGARVFARGLQRLQALIDYFTDEQRRRLEM